jgi:hypothetical protein
MGQALVFGLIGSSALVIGGAIGAYWRAPHQISGVLLAFPGRGPGFAGRHTNARGIRARPSVELDGDGGWVLAVVYSQRLSVMLAAGSGSPRARAGLPEWANHESEGVPTSRRHHREDTADQEIDQPLVPVGLLGGPGPQRAEPTVDRQVYREGQREEQRRHL